MQAKHFPPSYPSHLTLCSTSYFPVGNEDFRAKPKTRSDKPDSSSDAKQNVRHHKNVFSELFNINNKQLTIRVEANVLGTVTVSVCVLGNRSKVYILDIVRVFGHVSTEQKV